MSSYGVHEKSSGVEYNCGMRNCGRYLVYLRTVYQNIRHSVAQMKKKDLLMLKLKDVNDIKGPAGLESIGRNVLEYSEIVDG